MNRWTLLKHKKIDNRMLDIHYDFLLENGQDCKTWKLLVFPEIDGASVDIFEHSNHRLFWLTIESKVLTNNRGYVKRVDHGIFKPHGADMSSSNFSIILNGNYINGLFKKNANLCQLISLNS
tara:strand:+ start:116 stop:481 length:366 start_codon:yes stop_codon:yes gene_type:complete